MNFERLRRIMRSHGATPEEIEEQMDYIIDRDRVEAEELSEYEVAKLTADSAAKFVVTGRKT